MVCGEVGSGGVCRHCLIVLVWRLGVDAVIYVQTKGEAYSVGGGGILCQWRRTLSVTEAEAKR